MIVSSLNVNQLDILLFTKLLSSHFNHHPFVVLKVYYCVTFFFNVLRAGGVVVTCIFNFLTKVTGDFLSTNACPDLVRTFPHSPKATGVLVGTFISDKRFLLPLVVDLLI